MALLKKAIKDVTLNMAKDQGVAEAMTPSDKLGYAVNALKALDGGRWDRLEGAVKELPELSSCFSLKKACEGDAGERRKLQQTILELAKEDQFRG